MKPSAQTTKWFFIIISAVVLYLFWQVLEPFSIVLITSGIAAILLTPLDKKIRTLIKSPRLSALVVILGFFLVIVGPLTTVGILLIQEAKTIVNASTGQGGWIETFDITKTLLFTSLPEVVQQEFLSIDVIEVTKSAADWAVDNLGTVFSSTAQAIFHTFIFFIVLYYMLADRDKIRALLLDISPFKNKLDTEILSRISHTVRSVVFGALIIAIVQAALATIGMTIFGVPGALLWGSLVIIAAQVPMLGVALVMVPAIAYLFIVGHVGAAIGLLIWSLVAVGLVDNLLSPKLIGSKTKMNELLILISILGGLQAFGAIGFIIGPTILAAVIVVVELYKSGMLEQKN